MKPAVKETNGRAEAFSVSYADSGLFGVSVTSEHADQVKTILNNSIKVLKSISSGSIDAAQLERAKKEAIMRIDSAETQSGLLSTASSLFISGQPSRKQDIIEKIKAVKGDEIASVWIISFHLNDTHYLAARQEVHLWQAYRLRIRSCYAPILG